MIKTVQGCASLYVTRVKDRLLYKNRNWLAAIVGDTGSGKTYAAISLALSISGRGHVHITFTPKEFLELLNTGKLSKGDTVICDEFGVSMNSRDWYTVQNKLLSAVLQTFRYLNIAVIFTTPDSSYIDSQAKKLFHALFEMEKNIDYKNQMSWAKPFDVYVNRRYGDFFYVYPVFRLFNKKVQRLTRFGFPMPPEDILEAYEERKLVYGQKINKEAWEAVKNAEAKEIYTKNDKAILESETAALKAKARIDAEERFSKACVDLEKDNSKYIVLRGRKKVIDWMSIAGDYNISQTRAKYIQKKIERDINA